MPSFPENFDIKTIHCITSGSITVEVSKNVKTGFVIVYWSENDIIKYINDYDKAYQMSFTAQFNKIDIAADKFDFLKYFILYVFGGVVIGDKVNDYQLNEVTGEELNDIDILFKYCQERNIALLDCSTLTISMRHNSYELLAILQAEDGFRSFRHYLRKCKGSLAEINKNVITTLNSREYAQVVKKKSYNSETSFFYGLITGIIGSIIGIKYLTSVSH